MNEERIVNGELTSSPGTLLQDMRTLRDQAEFAFNRLLDVTAVDRGDAFEVLYRLNSWTMDRDLVVRVTLPAAESRLPSVAGLWETALFGEREVQDMFGIEFTGHPDPRPLLAPEEGFGFFPLRKSYQLPGRPGQSDGR